LLTHQVEQEVREVQLAAAGHWSVAPGVETGTLASQLPAGLLVLHAAGDSGPSLAALEGRHVPDDLQYPQPP
jgi:hypothetical protein